MSRDYRPMLEVAQELQFFTGYLDTEDKKRQMAVQARFDSERRKFVYELFNERDDHNRLVESVSGDLDRIAATTTEYNHGAIEEVRAELLQHIDRQSSNSPIMRFIVRWGPPTVGVAFVIAYIVARAYR